MDDAEQTAVIRRVTRGDPLTGSWADHTLADPVPDSSPAADTAAGLASMSFMTAAVRRRRRVWIAGALIGLLLGLGYLTARPPAVHATAQAFMTLGPNEDLNTAITTDIALAQSRPVAILALRRQGLHKSVSSYLSTYTAAEVTNRVLLITSSARSSAAAVASANAITRAFLQFRADQLRVYQQLETAALRQETAGADAQARPLTQQIAALQNATGATTKTNLGTLETQLNQLIGQQSSAQAAERSVVAQTNTAVRGSYLLDAAAPVPHSVKKTDVIYVLTGLIAGLALSVGYIVIAALVSDRLRSRDEIAHALGGSIRLSVGRIRVRRGLRRRAGLGAVDAPGIQRIAGHLGDCLPSGAAGAALAVVPADDTDVAAVALMALALSCAREGKRVIVADLVPGRPVARLLNVTDPGVKAVSVQDTRMVVVVPEPGDVAAAGPLAPAGPPTATAASARPRPPTADLVSAYSSADVLLTLAAVDPMLGAEHLATWTAGLAVLVTAGESTWTRVQAVGEMIRLSGTRLVTAVLVGADATDESLGIASPPRAGRHLRADEPIADTAQLPRLPQEIRIPLDSSHPADGTPVIPADAGAGPPPPDTR